MKAWEKIAELNGGQVKSIFETHCPSTLEEKYHIIGEKRFNAHCKLGCSPKCTEEYLNLKVKG